MSKVGARKSGGRSITPRRQCPREFKKEAERTVLDGQSA